MDKELPDGNASNASLPFESLGRRSDPGLPLQDSPPPAQASLDSIDSLSLLQGAPKTLMSPQESESEATSIPSPHSPPTHELPDTDALFDSIFGSIDAPMADAASDRYSGGENDIVDLDEDMPKDLRDEINRTKSAELITDCSDGPTLSKRRIQMKTQRLEVPKTASVGHPT